MLESFLKNKESICHLMLKDLSVLTFSSSKWDIMDFLKELLYPIYIFTKETQSRNFSIFSVLLTCKVLIHYL